MGEGAPRGRGGCARDGGKLIVAALYIDPRGPYPGILGPELCWDATRDARLYEGPHPVVAHPPCGPWGGLRHQYRGAEHDCAPRAVEQVRRWGGVLEHPAGSLLWQDRGLPDPGGAPIEDDGRTAGLFPRFSLEVEQVEWGHVARKRTWLYIVGVSRERVLELLAARPYPGREPTHWCSGGGTGRGKPPPGIKICSAEQRRRTPPAFAEFLIEIASAARRGA